MVSVVIPAFNEEKTIAKVLDSLEKQSLNEKFEVILVDNNSNDKTVRVARNFGRKFNLRIISELRRGRGTARATGFAKAGGEIIFSTDADTILPERWLETGLKYFENPQVVGVTGPWEIKDLGGHKEFFLNHFQEVCSVYPAILILGCPWLTGFNFAVRKKAYLKSGGFNPDLNAHEDIDLTLRLRKLGKIIYAWDLKPITSGRRFKKGLRRGFWTYQKEWLKKNILGDKQVFLEDAR